MGTGETGGSEMREEVVEKCLVTKKVVWQLMMNEREHRNVVQVNALKVVSSLSIMDAPEPPTPPI